MILKLLGFFHFDPNYGLDNTKRENKWGFSLQSRIQAAMLAEATSNLCLVVVLLVIFRH